LLRGGVANHGYDDLTMVRILGHMANMGYKATVNMSKQILDIQGKKHTRIIISSKSYFSLPTVLPNQTSSTGHKAKNKAWKGPNACSYLPRSDDNKGGSSTSLIGEAGY